MKESSQALKDQSIGQDQKGRTMYPLTYRPAAEKHPTSRVIARRVSFARCQIWPRILQGMACAIGALCLTATTMGQAPSFSWTAKGGGPNQDFARSVAVDGWGNVFLTGAYYDSGSFGGATLPRNAGRYSAYLVMYDTKGSVAWAKSISPGAGDNAYGYTVVAGSSGEVYVIGISENAYSMFISKYSSSGNVIWTRYENGGRAVGSGLSPDGGVYVTGYFTSATFGTNTLVSVGDSDAFLAKYDSNGNVLWVRRAGGLSREYASGLAVDGQGNAFVTGAFQDLATFGSVVLIGSANLETFVAKCDAQGNFLWATRLPGQLFSDLPPNRYNTIATDAQGNAYVGGSHFTTSFPGSGFIAKVNPSGALVWNKPVAGAVSSIASDSLGNIYFSGSFDTSINLDGQTVSTAGSSDVFVYKLAPNGTAIWAKRAGFVFDDFGNGLAVDAAGNAFVTGTFHDTTQFETNVISGNGDDIFVAKLGNNTVQLAPTIVAHPQNQTVSPGATATFGVTANGAPPLRFQWRFNGTNIAGATNALLHVTNALLANVGSYSVRVSNNAGAVDSSPASLTVVPGTPSFADSFANRGILIGFTNFVTGNNSEFTRESGEPDHAGRKGAHSAWLTWTAPDNGTCEMETFGSSFDTVLAVYTGASLSNLTFIAANDDASNEVLQSRVAFSAVAGAAYQIAVDGYSAADAGNITYRLSFSNAAPIIAVQPQNRSVVQGSNATFSVTALGYPPLTYQWRFNGTEIAGATNATLVLGNAQTANEGFYSVVVANGFGSAISEGARLTVLRPPAIASLSADSIVVAGSTAQLEVMATGTGPLSYQWRFGGTNLPGALLSVLTLSDITRSQAGLYSVVVSNSYGAVTSAAVNVNVHHSLTLLTNGAGAITADPDLPSYSPLSVVALTATPAPGAYFVNWSGSASGTNNPLNVIMTSNQFITANFAATSLTLGTEGPGDIHRSPERSFYSLGEQVTLAGVPGRWHAFASWSDGVLENPRTIVIGPSNTYTAVFTPTQALETLTFGGVTRTAPVGMPAILVNESFVTSGSVTNFDENRVRIVSSFPESVILFTLDGTPPGFDSIFYDDEFSVRQIVTLRAIAYNSDFGQAVEADPMELVIVRTHSVSIRTDGGGTVASLPSAARHVAGSSVTLSAEPAPGWRFLQWLGDVSGTNPTATISLNRDLCAEAVFGTTSTSAVVGNGTVIMNPPTPELPFGIIQTLTAVPDPGSYFALWGGAGSGTNNPLRIAITNAEPAVTAVFQPLPANQHSFTAISDGFGTVTNRPRGSRFTSGTTITLSAVADAGQTFVAWSGDASGTQNPLTVTMSSSKLITAQFTKRPTLAVPSCAEPSLADGFRFLISGEFGAPYRVEKSADGQSWLPLATITNLFGVTQFTDTTATNAELRMYRAAPLGP